MDMDTQLEQDVLGIVSADREANPHARAGADGMTECGRCSEALYWRMPEIAGVPGLAGRLVRRACACERAEDEARDTERARREAERRLDSVRSMSMMDARLREYTFARWVGSERQRRICKRYVDNWYRMWRDGKGLLLYGPPGTGKTYAAAAIANELINQGVQIVATSTVQLTNLAWGEDVQRYITTVQQSGGLILDDLGAERSTPTAQERVYALIDSCTRAGIPMIITTNLTGQQLTSVADMGARRVYERVIKDCYQVEFKGPSRRLQMAKAEREEIKRLLEGED